MPDRETTREACKRAEEFIEAAHESSGAAPELAKIAYGFARDVLALVAALEAAEKERDFAIAHDRQPYPTAEAYERVCALFHAAEGHARTAEGYFERIANFAEGMGVQYLIDLVAEAQAALAAAPTGTTSEPSS